ncbi:MAG TPA: 2OG-Fe(II) oxygenase [Pyrinomonadaceae bacterium]
MSSAPGIYVVKEFIDSRMCERLLDSINRCRSKHKIPPIYRPANDRPLNYSVIDGHRISRDLPEILDLYNRVTSFIKEIDREIEPIKDARVACNVNITPSGGTYRYHYDRNAVTAILYLNETDGGETECYPNYRLDLFKDTHPVLQRQLDRLLQTEVCRRLSMKETLVRPETGKLLIMRGNRCLHSVLPVRGHRERVNVIMSYDYPGAHFNVADELNSYLYETTVVEAVDPNYAGHTQAR